MYMSVCMYIRVDTYICWCTYVTTCMNVCMYICTYICTYVYVNTCVYMYLVFLHMYVCV